jgi:hypothetical protein
MSVCPMYSADDLKISNPDQHVHLVIKEFLKMGEGEARCCIQMPRGILLLQTVPGNPASGAIYMYDRLRRSFYRVHFDGPDDDLTLFEFEQLMEEYELLRYVEEPTRLEALAANAAEA